MPFPWQTTGDLRGGVPNQMNASTPQNAEGFGVPWGKAMFNLPRYQMPGTNVNFGGGFNLSGDMNREGPNQMGMAPGANIGNVRFSLNRQASSDPVQNIINDIQNPLGGMSLGFTGGGGTGQGQGTSKAQPGGLKNRMTPPDTGIGGAPELGSTQALAEGISTNTAAQYGQFGRPSPVPQYLAQQYTASPMSLRTQMLAQQQGSPLSNFYFI